MRILLAYFSFTGNTEKVGNLILNNFKRNRIDCDLFKIKPLLNLPYLLWLLLSFVPGLPFPLKNLKLLNLKFYDVIVLGTPKWTFNCPPVTSFIYFLKKMANPQKKLKIAVFLTYGGFREDIYLEKLERKLNKSGFSVIAVRKFKRADIQQNKIEEDAQRFCFEILNSLNPSNSYVSQP